MEPAGSAQIPPLTPSQIGFKTSEPDRNERFQIIQIQLERRSPFAEHTGAIPNERGDSLAVGLEQGPIPVPVKAGASQGRIEQHVMPEVSRHVPPEPGQAIDIGRVRALGSHALPKNAIGIISENKPRDMTGIAPIHLISSERDEVIGGMLERPHACFISHVRCRRPGVIVNARRGRFPVARRNTTCPEENEKTGKNRITLRLVKETREHCYSGIILLKKTVAIKYHGTGCIWKPYAYKESWQAAKVSRRDRTAPVPGAAAPMDRLCPNLGARFCLERAAGGTPAVRFGCGVRAVSRIPWPLQESGAYEPRASVMDCGSPLPLCVASLTREKRQRAAAVQNLADYSNRASEIRLQFL